MDRDLPTWQCRPFDELMEAAFTVMPLSTAQWYVDTLLPYRDALRKGEGTKAITMKVWHDLLTTFFMLLPVPNYHQFGFLIMLEHAPFMLAPREQPKQAPETHTDMVWRAATLLCALREKKRETLCKELPDEVIAGFKQTKQPIYDLWRVRRFRIGDNKERVGEKAAYAQSQGEKQPTPDGHNALSVTIAQGPAVIVLDIGAEATPADVAQQLQRILGERFKAEKRAPTREQQPDKADACTDQGEAYCKLTYVLRTELMAALGGDAAWHEVWDAVQDTDFALALFPQVCGSERCAEDPRQGAITYLQSAVDGGIVGDKHTLCVLGDGDACFAWDHALMDGAPAAWLSSQVFELANTYGPPPSPTSSASSATAGAPDSSASAAVSVRELATPSPADWSKGVRAAIAAGHQLCRDRIASPSYTTTHMRIEACGRRRAREKGLSADATFQAALQLALAEVGHPDLLHVAEVVSTRHYRWGRSTNMAGNSAAMDAFVAAARAATYEQQGAATADKAATHTSPSSPSPSPSPSVLRARAALLLRGAARVHKERIKAHKRDPVVFANFLAGFGEAALREEGARAATASEADAQGATGTAQGGDDAFNLPARCVALFGEIQQQPNRPAGSRSLMMDSVVISNAPAWPGVGVFTTTPSAPLVVSYIVRDNNVELDVISRCADTPVNVPDWLLAQGKVDSASKEGALMDVFPAVLERALHQVDELLALL